MTDLQSEMGTPQEIADEFLAHESAANIKKHIVIAKWIKIGIVVALCAIMLTVVLSLIDAHLAHRGYAEESIVSESINE